MLPKLWFTVCLANLVLLPSLNSSSEGNNKPEWPQWRGPNRDGVSPEVGVCKPWQIETPEVKWRIRFWEGYSGISVSDGYLYTMFAKEDGEYVICLKSDTGEEVWRYKVDERFENESGNGPRSTPTLDEDLVFSISAQSKLHALTANDGSLVWQRDLVKDFGATVPFYGTSTSPLVEEDLLIVHVGGKPDFLIAAFEKKSGDVVWNTLADKEPGYSSPIAVTIDGIRQIISLTGTSLFSLSPRDGELYWRYDWNTLAYVNVAAPVFIPDNKIFISSSYGMGAALLRISTTGDSLERQEVWRSNVMRNHFASSVFFEGYLYGFDNATLKCIDAMSGEQQWAKRGLGRGSLIYADRHLVILGEHGELVLIEASPVEYKEKANTQICTGKTFTAPSLANGKLYIRTTKEFICLNLK